MKRMNIGQGFGIKNNNETYEIYPGYHTNNSNCPSEVVIPKTINGVAVTTISNNAFNDNYDDGGIMEDVTNIIFPKGTIWSLIAIDSYG